MGRISLQTIRTKHSIKLKPIHKYMCRFTIDFSTICM